MASTKKPVKKAVKKAAPKKTTVKKPVVKREVKKDIWGLEVPLVFVLAVQTVILFLAYLIIMSVK